VRGLVSAMRCLLDHPLPRSALHLVAKIYVRPGGVREWVLVLSEFIGARSVELQGRCSPNHTPYGSMGPGHCEALVSPSLKQCDAHG